MRSILTLKIRKRYFICSGNNTCMYEILHVNSDSVVISAVKSDNIKDVYGKYTLTSENFNSMKIKRLNPIIIFKINSGLIRIHDLWEQYFN